VRLGQSVRLCRTPQSPAFCRQPHSFQRDIAGFNRDAFRSSCLGSLKTKCCGCKPQKYLPCDQWKPSPSEVVALTLMRSRLHPVNLSMRITHDIPCGTAIFGWLTHKGSHPGRVIVACRLSARAIAVGQNIDPKRPASILGPLGGKCEQCRQPQPAHPNSICQEHGNRHPRFCNGPFNERSIGQGDAHKITCPHFKMPEHHSHANPTSGPKRIFWSCIHQ